MHLALSNLCFKTYVYFFYLAYQVIAKKRENKYINSSNVDDGWQIVDTILNILRASWTRRNEKFNVGYSNLGHHFHWFTLPDLILSLVIYFPTLYISTNPSSIILCFIFFFHPSSTCWKITKIPKKIWILERNALLIWILKTCWHFDSKWIVYKIHSKSDV